MDRCVIYSCNKNNIEDDIDNNIFEVQQQEQTNNSESYIRYTSRYIIQQIA